MYGKKAFIKKDGQSVVIPKVKSLNALGDDVLVNNAGPYLEGKILDGGVRKAYDETIQVNLTVPILLTADAAPYLVKTKGSIVNISSVTVLDTLTYGVSKAGLDFFTKASALKLGASGVRVNSVNPGAVLKDSMLVTKGVDAMLKVIKSRSVLPKLIESDEVAELTLYLASEKAKSIAGQNYTIDNGFLVKGASMSLS